MKSTSYFPSKYHSRVFKIAFGIFLVLCILKLSGQVAKKNNNIHSVIGPYPIADTTKPSSKPIYHHYILKGSDTMFILLQTLILSPEDVTPRNKNVVINWFNQNIKIDSTKNK